MKKRILIADDHAVVRKGIRQIIEEESEMTVVGEAADNRELLEKARKEEYDIIVIDLSMPLGSGLDTIKQLTAEYPRRPILVLSMYSEEQYALRAFKAGASGYLTKESAPEQLVGAIRQIASGRKYVSPHLAELLVNQQGKEGQKLPHELLSDREYQIMCMIASGTSVSEIAADLSLSVKTVSTHRSRLLQKMHFKNNVSLTQYVLQNHLL